MRDQIPMKSFYDVLRDIIVIIDKKKRDVGPSSHSFSLAKTGGFGHDFEATVIEVHIKIV